MRLLLIANAAASSVTPRKRVVIARLLSGAHQVEVALTQRRGHATELAREAATDGTEVVVVLGGDGTLNEVANGLAGSDCAMAVLPGGSTNVLARTLGIADDPVQATLGLLEALDLRLVRRVTLGRVVGLEPPSPDADLGGRGPASTSQDVPRWFTFHVGIGWDAATVAEVERRGRLKAHLNHLLFIYAGLVAYFRDTDRSSPWMRVTVDGQTLEGWQCLVLNSNPYTFVGSRPFDVDPGATLDARPTLVVATAFAPRDLLSLTIAALRGGGITEHRAVATFQGFSHARVEGLRSLPWQVDGDYLGEVAALELGSEERVLSLVTPGAPRPRRLPGERRIRRRRGVPAWLRGDR
ncbi:MAG: diacylglycerol kinase family protein [Microthrixaceae bacterium]